MTALSFILQRAPHFAAVADLDALISIASGQISQNAYKSLYPNAVGLLVCHWLALRKRDESEGHIGTSGQISSQKTGDLARSYSGGFFSGTVQSSLDPYLAQTSWGVELANLQQSCVPAFFSRRM